MTRISHLFERRARDGKTVLVAYVTVGFPSVETSYEACVAALEAGADVLELGVPFSDPSADGPVIAAASYEAIHRGGSLSAALGIARRLRETRDEPIVLFTYYNPVVAYGDEKLVQAANDVGVDGLLVVDLPPDEGAELRASAQARGISVIPLIAPTSGKLREDAIFAGASGFIYYVSVTGVTGSGVAPLAEAGAHAKELRERSGLPVVVGFGIDSADKARLAQRAGAPGVVVGTAIVRALGSDDGVSRVRELVGSIRAGLDAS